MKEQTRAEPRFSLCGLNCGLCPMYHISETEHCTGCGGAGRPSCAVQRCAREHGGVEYCFQCAEYPCARYTRAEPYDSFVPHRNVQRDFARAARDGLDAYRAMLEEKEALLRFLLREYNDGRRKSLFCTARDKKSRTFSSNSKKKSHFADFLTEQTLDFVLHRFFCSLAEMHTDDIGCFADLLSHSRARGTVGCGIVHSKSSCK